MDNYTELFYGLPGDGGMRTDGEKVVPCTYEAQRNSHASRNNRQG